MIGDALPFTTIPSPLEVMSQLEIFTFPLKISKAGDSVSFLIDNPDILQLPLSEKQPIIVH